MEFNYLWSCCYGFVEIFIYGDLTKGAFTHNVKSIVSENLGNILSGAQC
jgi:hypothetical protein